MSKNFGDLGQKLNKVIEYILGSQNLCKLLYYDTNNPLDESDITDTSILIMNKIYPMPKYSMAETEKTSRLSIYFRDFKKFENNIGFREPLLCFDIMSHQDCWMIDSDIRPLRIFHEIDKLFNNIYLKEISTRQITFKYGDILNISDYISGYYLHYHFVESSYLGC